MPNTQPTNISAEGPPPEILAPAGNRAGFLAALAAGADAIYCGLKQFSARMEARNFAVEELAALIDLAHDKGRRVYLTVNTLLRTAELEQAGGQIARLCRLAAPDALIVQDPGLPLLARQAGFTGELHLSTLANVSFAAALPLVREGLGVTRVVIPRELSIDEIKALAAACPPGLGLEVFVHGALCYGVSGRCYWSSFLGGRSGLRGSCVQPCRRVYRQEGRSGRHFSCLDLSLDVLARVLRPLAGIRAWKIEGRKKGPHYVYYTVQAYRLLRDEGGDPRARRAALDLLAQCLGRADTHYGFLPQRPQDPLDLQQEKGSGLRLGRLKGTRRHPFLMPRETLLAGDVLRIGTEDQAEHRVIHLTRAIPRGGRFVLDPLPDGPGSPALPVFLVDRREPALARMLLSLERELAAAANPEPDLPLRLKWPAARSQGRTAPRGEMVVTRKPAAAASAAFQGVWLSREALDTRTGVPADRIWWWLAPVLWPGEAENLRELAAEAIAAGSRRFVINAPWQAALLGRDRQLEIWAGPFCNLANPFGLEAMAGLGCRGAFASPELGAEDLLALPRQSPLPMALVIGGFWPLCISRIKSATLAEESAFRSPRGEDAWLRRYGESWWVFPNWRLDLGPKKKELLQAGYRILTVLEETPPAGLEIKMRPGLWNWEGGV